MGTTKPLVVLTPHKQAPGSMSAPSTGLAAPPAECGVVCTGNVQSHPLALGTNQHTANIGPSFTRILSYCLLKIPTTIFLLLVVEKHLRYIFKYFYLARCTN